MSLYYIVSYLECLEVLTLFMEDDLICKSYKKQLLPIILDSYLVLNRTVNLRTKYTVDSAAIFLTLINRISSGLISLLHRYTLVSIHTYIHTYIYIYLLCLLRVRKGYASLHGFVCEES